jgi:hypothetical protein
MKKVLIAPDYGPTTPVAATTGFLQAKTMGVASAGQNVILDPMYYSSMEYSPLMGFSGPWILAIAIK